MYCNIFVTKGYTAFFVASNPGRITNTTSTLQLSSTWVLTATDSSDNSYGGRVAASLFIFTFPYVMNPFVFPKEDLFSAFQGFKAEFCFP